MELRVAVALLGVCSFIGLVDPRDARADLPPPPGQTRVHYSFRVTGSAQDVVLVAFPMYRSGGGHVVELDLDKDLTPVQGWTPGIYSIRAADLAPLRASEDDEALRALLASKGRVCVKAVPRVFNVPSSTKVSSITDVFSVDAAPDRCKASLGKALYAGRDGEKGEGTFDASGRRLPPPPFGRDLPPVGDLGPAQATASPATAAPSEPAASPATPTEPTRPEGSVAPPRSGCSGCVMPASNPADESGLIWLAGLALALGRRAGQR